MARRCYCNCCGEDFPEPYGMFEKIRCPNCDAVRYDDEDDYIIEAYESEE